MATAAPSGPKPGSPSSLRPFLPGLFTPHVPSTSTSPAQELPGFLPARARPLLGAGGEGGISLAGPRVASLAPGHSGQCADRQAPDAISGGAPFSAPFPFPSTVGNREGGGECRRHEPPAPGGAGAGSRWPPDGQSGASRIEGDGETSPHHASLCAAGLTKAVPVPVPCSQPLGCPAGSFNAL